MRSTPISQVADMFRRAPFAWTSGLAALGLLGAVGLSFAEIETGSGHTLRPYTVLDAIGVTAEPLDRDSRRTLHLASAERGAVVTSTRAGGPAARSGLLVGDVVERAGDGRVDGPKTLTRGVERAGAHGIDLVIVRAGRHRHLTINRGGANG